MLEIQLEKASKRFQFEWIFKNLTLQLTAGTSLAVTGSNGSGKSTLLKCISGLVPISSGNITYSLNNKSLPESEWFSTLSISTPYMEVPEEFTLEELIRFHFKFKPLLEGKDIDDVISIAYLEQHRKKQVGQFSSGMKQRLKLALALFSDVPLILLDEPTSNLDLKGINWYQNLIEDYKANRIVLVCSNEEREFNFCTQKISMEDYK